MKETTILKHGIVITMDKHGRVIEDGAVVIEDNKIVDVNKVDMIEKKYHGDVIINAKHKVVMPGLIDLHIHTSLLRGFCDNVPLLPYVDKFWWPTAKAMKPNETYTAALLTYCESIKSGTTCVNDLYIHMIKCAEAAEKVGIRAVLATEATDASFGLESLRDNERLIIEKNGAANQRIKTRVGIDWLPTSSTEFLQKARALADKYNVGIHAHANESLAELHMCLERFGKTPVELAYELGLLGSDCVLAHCVWLSDNEIQMLKETNSNVSHNPVSNAKLGSGVARVPDLLNAGVNVGLGHDDTTCNNNNDMFETMKMASLIQRATKTLYQYQEAGIMNAKQVLKMATINGARGLMCEKEIGSLEPGKKADLILVNLKSMHMTPLILGKYSNLLSHLVYSAHGEDVDTVIVDGKVVMENRVLQNINEAKVVQQANEVCKNLSERLDLKTFGIDSIN